MTSNNRRKLLMAMYAVAGAIALLGWWRAMPDTVDDAYITFRYAENFLGGHGLVYNVGDRVEGYSNPLFLFLMIALGAIRVPLSLGAHLIGLLSFVVCILSAFHTAGYFCTRRIFQHLCASLVLANFPLLYYSVTGMETGFYAALIAAAVWRFYSTGERIDVAGGLLWLAVSLTRPEGILYPFLLGIMELILWVRIGRSGDRMEIKRSIIVLTGVGAAYLIFLFWRKIYFGDWLPNTFRAKPMGTADLEPGITAIRATANYLFGFILQSGALIPVFSVLALSVFAGTRALWIIVAAGVLFGAYTGGDWMPGARYLLPVFVPFIILSCIGFELFVGWMNRNHLSTAVIKLATSAIIGAAFLAPCYRLYEFYSEKDRQPYHILATRDNEAAALAMKKEFGSNKTIVAHRIGALGYYGEMEIIDLFGLVDKRIADIVGRHPEYHPGIERGNDVDELKEYIASKEPELVLVVSNYPKIEEEKNFYGFSYRHIRSYALGKDQWWHLYER